MFCFPLEQVNALISGAIAGGAIAALSRSWKQVIPTVCLASAFRVSADYARRNWNISWWKTGGARLFSPYILYMPWECIWLTKTSTPKMDPMVRNSSPSDRWKKMLGYFDVRLLLQSCIKWFHQSSWSLLLLIWLMISSTRPLWDFFMTKSAFFGFSHCIAVLSFTTCVVR